MSWWDYGYQIAGLGNRTVIVDNNTWNNSHIATVGLAMSANEETAYEICEFLHVDYVLVVFGAPSWMSSDDIGKFLWMVRIAGGVYPHVKEEHYLGSGGVYSSLKLQAYNPFLIHLVSDQRTRVGNYAQLSYVQTLLLQIW